MFDAYVFFNFRPLVPLKYLRLSHTATSSFTFDSHKTKEQIANYHRFTGSKKFQEKNERSCAAQQRRYESLNDVCRRQPLARRDLASHKVP